MPPSSYQCRSDPQSPTAVIRTKLSPSAGTGVTSSARRMSRAAWNRAARLRVGIVDLPSGTSGPASSLPPATVRHAAVAVTRTNGDDRSEGTRMLSDDDYAGFRRTGLMRIPGAVSATDAGTMADRIWQHLSGSHGIVRD